MDSGAISTFVGELWDAQIVPQLVDYIRIPNKSPMFDAKWAEHGYMDKAVALMEAWARAQPIPGMQIEVVRLAGRTPLIFIEIPGQGDDCVLLYGHLDKQPEMTGWSDHLGPWQPVIEGDRLYGRGGADDGYAISVVGRGNGLAGTGRGACALRGADEAARNRSSTCPPTSITWPNASASRRWWSAWIRAAATTSSCGAPHRCAAWPAAT
jgi:hypothetical protein